MERTQLIKRFAFACAIMLGPIQLLAAQAPVEEVPGNIGDATMNPRAGATYQDEMGLDSGCGDEVVCPPSWRGRLFAGAEYRLIRPHFSEAVSFAVVNDSISSQGFSRHVDGYELDFDYDSSFRVFLGYRLHDLADVRLTYWNLDAETTVGLTAGPGQTIVDPFGSIGTTGAVIDTSATVHMNVFDLEYLVPMDFHCGRLGFTYSAGLRFADVTQFYDSIISAAGTVNSNGRFDVDFFGVGPYLSLKGESRHGDCGQFSLFAKGAMALLVGQYDVTFAVELPGVTASQAGDRVRTVPVFESELGAAWRPNERWTLSAGWMFAAWSNIGTSGSTFDGERLPVAPVDTVYGETDDADIMSFDGLFLRAEFGY